MFNIQCGLRDLVSSKNEEQKPSSNSGGFEKKTDVLEPPQPAFVVPQLWDDFFTLDDIENINLEEFIPSVLKENEAFVEGASTNDNVDSLLSELHTDFDDLPHAASVSCHSEFSPSSRSQHSATHTLPHEVNRAVAKKARKRQVPTEMKDDKYWTRRIKNNASAKRSRDARRLKECEVGTRAAIAEKEVEKLKIEVSNLLLENQLLREQLAKSLSPKESLCERLGPLSQSPSACQLNKSLAPEDDVTSQCCEHLLHLSTTPVLR